MGDFAKEINSRFTDEKVKAVLNIKYTASWLDQMGMKTLRPFNISEQQYNILRILRGAHKKITVSDVKKRMIQKSPNATRLMDKLCDKKYVERSRCENDRRVVYAQITKKGLELLDSIKMDAFDKVMHKMTVEEAITINKLLDKIR